MKTRLLLVPLVLALVASLAACGGGGSSVPANAVAVVNGTPIPISEFNSYFQQAVAQQVAQGGGKPTPGTPQYTQLRNQVVAELVLITEVKQQAPKEGVSVTTSDVTKFIANLIKTNYSGSSKKFAAWLKTQGLTMKEAQQEVFINLLSQKIHAKVTASAKVTTAQERAYYQTNIAQFNTPASTTRNIQYILFKCAAQGSTTCAPSVNRAKKKLADKVEQKLQSGASFTAMAKKYSEDPTTAPTGGHLCISKSGQSGSCIPTVPDFSKAGFALKTGATSQPVDATSAADQGYGWFIIKALAPAKTVKAHVTPFSQAKTTIQQSLISQAQQTLWQTWISDLAKSYQGKISYASTYAPPTTTALPTTT